MARAACRAVAGGLCKWHPVPAWPTTQASQAITLRQHCPFRVRGFHETSQRMTGSDSVLREIENRIGQLSSTPMVSPPEPLVLIISGPSGVGKDAVLERLRARHPELHFIVTATSREPRPGEVDAIDYHFVSKAQFESWIQNDQLLEHAIVYGEYKGIPRPQVEEALGQGKDVVLRIDVQGAATVRKLLPKAVSIFLVAESDRVLVDRLIGRQTDSLDKLVARIQTAKEELQRLDEFDYVVVNREGRLEEAVQQISGILTAEKARISRNS